MDKIIKLGLFDIIVTIPVKGGGRLVSRLKNDTDEVDDAQYRAAVDGIEALILAHACAGVDITSAVYKKGVLGAVSAICHEF